MCVLWYVGCFYGFMIVFLSYVGKLLVVYLGNWCEVCLGRLVFSFCGGLCLYLLFLPYVRGR